RCSTSSSFSSHAELSHFDVLEQLGRGAAGVVHRALHKTTRREVALKFVEDKEALYTDEIRHEYEILRGLHHPHIIQGMDFFISRGSAIVVMSYHAGTTLDNSLKAQHAGFFTEVVSRSLFGMLNLLISHGLDNLHLADFNCAGKGEDDHVMMQGCWEHAAPEVIDGDLPHKLQDIWSCGLVLHMMMTGSLPRRLWRFPDLDAFAAAMLRSPVNWERPQWQEASGACKMAMARCLS
ncbi:unnamed protein product, partial [Effrenium voratum]